MLRRLLAVQGLRSFLGPSGSRGAGRKRSGAGESEGGERCEEKIPVKAEYTALEGVKVTLLGASSPVGQSLALQLKQNPLVKELRLFDSKGAHGVAADLRHVSTSSKVFSFVGDNQIKYALKKTDIVVILGGKVMMPGGSNSQVFEENAPRMKDMAFACLRGAPNAIFAILVEPINSTLPLFAEVLRQNGVFCPNRVLGAVSTEKMRTRSLTASRLGLDPATVDVQVVGGASPETLVPVITGAEPGGMYLQEGVEDLISKLKSMTEAVTAAKKGVPPTISVAYAAAVFIDTLAKGLCGKEHEPFPALVRTNTLEGVKYLATPLRYGLAGVAENLGLPRLSRVEMECLEEAIPHLQRDIGQGEAFAASLPSEPDQEYKTKRELSTL